MRGNGFIIGLLAFATCLGVKAQNPFVDRTVKNLPSTTPSRTANVNITEKGNIADRKNVGRHESADLGLSVIWATSNIDAANAKGYYGRIVAWGELKEKSNYTPSTSSNYGKARSDIKGNVNFDVAAHQWGNGWRMPTYAEMKELREKCTWTWAKESGRWGYKIVSKINRNYIFLPAVGVNRSNKIDEMNNSGYYWTSTPLSNHNSAYRLTFTSSGINILEGSRFEGCYIRPVHSR